MGGLRSVASCLLDLATAEGLVLVVGSSRLFPESVPGEIWNIVPGVVISGVIELVQRVLRRVDSAGCLGGGVPSD